MADGNKTDQIPDELENLSPEELQERIQEEKKNAKRSLRFAFTALLAIVAVCIAWFVANNRVTMTGTQISAENTVPFELASIGSRQKVEIDKLKENNKNILSAGTSSQKYEKYIDIYTGTEETLEKGLNGNNPEFHVGTSGLAWYLNGQESLVPGAGGKLEFYLIPKKSGLTSAAVKLNLKGYTEDNSGKAIELDNDKIQRLLNGHILFFRHLDNEKGYYGWIGDEEELKLNAPGSETDNSATFTKDMPYKVTLYWKWPQYFRNYIYTDRSTQGDLFTNVVEQSEYSNLNDFINKQKNVNSSKLFYDVAATDYTQITADINNQMNDDTLNTCSNYYNQADEYIGKNARYVYVQIQVDPAD